MSILLSFSGPFIDILLMKNIHVMVNVQSLSEFFIDWPEIWRERWQYPFLYCVRKQIWLNVNWLRYHLKNDLYPKSNNAVITSSITVLTIRHDTFGYWDFTKKNSAQKKSNWLIYGTSNLGYWVRGGYHKSTPRSIHYTYTSTHPDKGYTVEPLKTATLKSGRVTEVAVL